MHEPLRLEYSCTPEELKDAQTLHAARTTGPLAPWIPWFVLLFVGCLTFAFGNVFPTVFSYFCPLVCVVSTYLLGIAYWQQSRRKKTRDEPPRVLLDVTAQELRLTGERGVVIFPWKTISKALQTDELFVLPDSNETTLIVVPKRVFADEGSCNWFREMSQQARTSVEATAGEVGPNTLPETKLGVVRLKVRYQFSDFLESAIMIWIIRVMLFLVAITVILVFMQSAQQPRLATAFSATEAFFYFCLPSLILLELGIVFTIAMVMSSRSRLNHSNYLIELNDAGLITSQNELRVTGDWSDIRYQETFRCFHLWRHNTDAWIQIPKRDFSTQDDVNRCRQLLTTHARNSSW